jgi:hypothetical protein
MATLRQRLGRSGDDDEPVKTAVDVTARRSRGGWLATLFSAIAVAASCVSVYISALQGAQLEVYLPPAFQYAMDGQGENFTIPVTIANGGARSSTVISMELEVTDAKTNATQRFFGAYLGEHPSSQGAAPVRQFAPLAVLGRAVVSETVRFYPVGPPRGNDAPRAVSGAGDYTLRLKVNTAAPTDPSLLDRLQGRAQPAPVTVQMVLPVLDYRGLMQMRSKDWVAVTGSGG